MRPLIIDDEAKATAARVLAHAEAHPYRPGRPGQTTPGDDPNFVAHFGTYRAVFTYTHADGLVYRHLSISVPADGKYPNPAAAFAIAEMFGFTGWNGQASVIQVPEGWQIEVNDAEHCIVLAQVCGHEHLRREAN